MPSKEGGWMFSLGALTAVVCLAIAATAAAGIPDDSHLLLTQERAKAPPPGEGIGDAYLDTLGRSLLPTPRPMLLMLVVPSFKPERAAYVERAGEGRFLAVSSEMRKPLWGLMMTRLAQRRSADGSYRVDNASMREALREITPEVERLTAPISAQTVERLRAVWRAALLDARPPPQNGPVGLDGVTYSFIAGDVVDGAPGAEGRRGTTWSPAAGTRMGDLVEVGERLAALAAAPAEARPALEAELVRRADALVARF